MTRIFRNIFMLTLIALCLGVVSACTEDPATTSGVISGKVTIGPAGDEPLSGVSVSISPVGLNRSTDYYGDYSFDNLEPGTYTLQFSRTGYQTATRTVALKAGDEVRVDAVLQPAASVPDMELVQSTLTFDKGVSEMTLGIRNTGTAATCDWSITGITVSWLSVTPRNGSTRKGSTSTVKVMVDRSALPSTGITSTTFNVVGEGFSLPVYVEVTNTTSGNQGEAKGEIRGRVTDSETGMSITGATVFINPGFVSATTDNNGLFTFTDLTPGNYTIDAAADGYNPGSATITVNGGATSSVVIKMVRKSSGGGNDPDPGPDDPAVEDYSKAKITTCDYRVKVNIVSCKRYGSTVVFDYTLINEGLGDVNDWRIYPPNAISLIQGGTRSSVWTSDGKEYVDKVAMTFRDKTTAGSTVIATSFPQYVPCSGSVTITDVSPSAKEFNLYLGVYAYPNSTYHMASSVITFLDVPIY